MLSSREISASQQCPGLKTVTHRNSVQALTPAAPATLVALRSSKNVVEVARAACVVVQFGALAANAGLMHLYSKVGAAARELTIGSGVDIRNARLACHLFLTTHRGGITFVFVAAVSSLPLADIFDLGWRYHVLFRTQVMTLGCVTFSSAFPANSLQFVVDLGSFLRCVTHDDSFV